MINAFARRRTTVLATGLLVAVCIELATVGSEPAAALAANVQRGEWIIAIAPGETLRVIGVSNPWARKTDAVQMKFQLFSGYGSPLIDPVEMIVHHGKMAFADVPHKVVNQQGEPNTGRIQMRVIYEVVAPLGSSSADFTPLAEVFDAATGRTTQRTGPIADVLYSASQ